MKSSALNIVRRSADGNFTTVANAALRDPRLSYRAKGLLAACLSHADGFSLSRAWIDSHGTEGREAITTAIRELRSFGYVMDEYHQEHSGGQITRKLVWTDIAQDPHQEPDSPSDGKPVARETRGAETPSHFKKTNLQEEQKKENQVEEESSLKVPSAEPKAKPVDPLAAKKLPIEAIPSDLLDCQELLPEFWQVKKGVRSERVFNRVCANLRQWPPQARRQALESAIACRWGDVFEPKGALRLPNGSTRRTQPGRTQPADEFWAGINHLKAQGVIRSH